MSRAETSQHESEGRGYAAAVVLGIMLVLGLLVLPFVPMLLAILESVTLGTRHVEEFCRDIGILEPLVDFYRIVFFWLK